MKKLQGIVSAIDQMFRLQKEYGFADYMEVRIFHQIAMEVVFARPLAVGDILRWNAVASSATLHGRIMRLRKKKLIELRKDSDLRCKMVVLTPKGEKFLSDLKVVLGGAS